MNQLIGGIFIALIFSFLVGLVAKNKTLGYFKGVVINFIVSLIFILLQVPFDCIIASMICVVIFIFLKNKDVKLHNH